MIIKESFNLIGWEHFGLWLVNQNFPQRKTENCNVFHFRLLPAKSKNKILWKVKNAQLWAQFAGFWANKNFWKTHFRHFFLFPDFYCGPEYSKKLMNKIQEKLITYSWLHINTWLQTNGHTDQKMHRKAWIHKITPAGGPKSFNIQHIKYLSLFLKHK